MWAANERDIYEMEMVVEYRSRAKGVFSSSLPIPDLQKIAQDVSDDDTTSATVRTYMNDSLRAYLADKKITKSGGESFLVLLFSVSDKNRPDGVVTDPFSDSRREERKQGDEGSDHSCHIVISLSPTRPGGKCHRVAIEHVPNISFSFVFRYLKWFFAQLSRDRSYTVDHPAGVKQGGGFKQIKARVNCEFRSVPSDELVQSLQNGEIGEIELVKEIDGLTAFDEKAYTTDTREKLLLKLQKRNTASARVLDVLGSVFRKAEEKKYKTARVTWKTSGVGHSANFDCGTAEPISKRYMKKVTVPLAKRLSASCETVDSHLSGVMMKWISSR